MYTHIPNTHIPNTHITTQPFPWVTSHADFPRAIESVPRLLGYEDEGELSTHQQSFKRDLPVLALEGTIPVLTTGPQGSGSRFASQPVMLAHPAQTGVY